MLSTRTPFGELRNVGFDWSSRSSVHDIRYSTYLRDFGILRNTNIRLMLWNRDKSLTAIDDEPIPTLLSPVPYSIRIAGIKCNKEYKTTFALDISW